MRVVFTSGTFKCRCAFESRHIPKEAGFRWDNNFKVWFTHDYGVASRLEPYLDDTAKQELAKVRLRVDTWTGGISVPPSEKLMDFQENAVLFALSRNRSYLGLDPGLGKTPIAAVITQTLFNHLPNGISVLYICPPFLTRNTEMEFNKWAPAVDVGHFPSRGQELIPHQMEIVPDSIILRDEVQEAIQDFAARAEKLGRTTVLFVDEAHRFKNHQARRTQALFGGQKKIGIASMFSKVVYLSGTPMPNRPIELFPVLNHSAPQTIHHMNWFEYAHKYCAAYETEWGWDYSGSSNLEQLVSQVVGTFMLRYRKADVLTSLPPKTEEMVVLSENMNPRLTKLSKEILSTLSPHDLMKGSISVQLGKDQLHLSTYRKELGIHKASACADFIKFLLEETDEAILVFAIHKEVIAYLNQELLKFNPLVITGDTRMEVRHEYVKTFQIDPTRRVFIGNIQAAGTGLTLTKATRVVFAEFSWVPSDNDQASDRAHRIGQQDNVFVQYLVYENSVDKAVIGTVLRKKKVTDQL